MSIFKLKHQFPLSQRTITLLTRQNPHKTLTSKPQYDAESKQKLKPLDVFFKESVGLIPKTENNEALIENETNELKRELSELERQVRESELERKKESKGVKSLSSLSSLFSETGEKNDGRKVRNSPTVYKELSGDMEELVRRLYEEGYFKNCNFVLGKLDFSWFETEYAREYLKFAAERFGNDHQDIAKWLSGSNLKKVALFGCPSLAKKSVFAAKRLRAFFEVQEDTVCRNCVLKQSCKGANVPVWRENVKTIKLVDVMKIITLYGLDSVDPRLAVPEEVKASVSKLLHEILKLSKPQSE